MCINKIKKLLDENNVNYCDCDDTNKIILLGKGSHITLHSYGHSQTYGLYAHENKFTKYFNNINDMLEEYKSLSTHICYAYIARIYDILNERKKEFKIWSLQPDVTKIFSESINGLVKIAIKWHDFNKIAMIYARNDSNFIYAEGQRINLEININDDECTDKIIDFVKKESLSR